MGRARADTSSADCSLLIWVEGLCPSSLLLCVFEIFYNKKLFFFFNVEGERMKVEECDHFEQAHGVGSLYDALWYIS